MYHSIDGSRETFSLRVIGDFPGTQEFWVASRDLYLKGAAFNAEGMTIPDAMQGQGYGRDLMADLVDTGRLIGIERIKLRAEDVGATGGRSIGFTERKWTDERSNVYEQQAFLCVATAIRGIVRPQTLPGSESDVSTPLIMNADLHRIVRRRDAACALA